MSIGVKSNTNRLLYSLGEREKRLLREHLDKRKTKTPQIEGTTMFYEINYTIKTKFLWKKIK